MAAAATWWIRQAITLAIADQARIIRVPVHMVEMINKLTRARRQLQQDLGREPTDEEIGKELEISAERVREIERISQNRLSLETPIGEEEDCSLPASGGRVGWGPTDPRQEEGDCYNHTNDDPGYYEGPDPSAQGAHFAGLPVRATDVALSWGLLGLSPEARFRQAY